MAKSGKRKSKQSLRSKILKTAPTISDHLEFPPLTESSTGSLSNPQRRKMNAEECGYVCIEGTTYFGEDPAEKMPDVMDDEESENVCETLRFYSEQDARLNIQRAVRQIPLDPSLYEATDVCEVIDEWEQTGYLEGKSGFIDGKENWIFLAKNPHTGESCAFRRICDMPLRNELAIHIYEAWNKVDHANIVRLQRIETTRQFGDQSLLFGYEYHANARTLKQYLEIHPERITVHLVWNFICQLLSGLGHIHKSYLAASTLDLKSILVTGLDECNLRINNVGIHDVIGKAKEPPTRSHEFYKHRATPQDQKGDLKLLADVVTSLADQIKGGAAGKVQELRQFATFLASGNGTVSQAISRIADRFLEFSSLLSKQKMILQNEITKESENGRLFRLICMICRIIQDARMDHSMDVEQATMILLFNDYLFGPGSLSHEVSCLNKLDVGSQDLIVLHGMGKQPICQTVIVSFAYLKDLFKERAATFDSGLRECIPCKQRSYVPMENDETIMQAYTFSRCPHSVINKDDSVYSGISQYPTSFM